MAAEKEWIMSRVPPGPGRALDLGGGRGELYPLLHERGFDYLNIDPEAAGPGAVRGDAHSMPFESESFDLVVSVDSLEQLRDPRRALEEVSRVLRPGGVLVAWVPFMHPHYGNDYFRYTALGLEELFARAGLQKQTIDAPLGPLTVLATMLSVMLRKAHLTRAAHLVRLLGARLDRRLAGRLPTAGYVAAYLAVAVKPDA